MLVFCQINEFVKLIENGKNENIEYFIRKGFEWCTTDTVEYHRDNYIGFGKKENRKSYTLETARHFQSLIPGSEIVAVQKP